MFTVWTYTFDDEVDMVTREPWRQDNLRQRDTIEAVGLLTDLTDEMGMLVLIKVLVVAVAQLIACAVDTSLNGVDKMVFTEEGKGAEDVRLVDGHNPSFQLSQREGLGGRGQGSGNQNAVGGGFHAVCLQQLYVFAFVHRNCIYNRSAQSLLSRLL